MKNFEGSIIRRGTLGLVLSAALVCVSGCGLLGVPPEFEERIAAMQRQSQQDTAMLSSLREEVARLEVADPSSPKLAEALNQISVLEDRQESVPGQIAGVRADLEAHYAAVANKVASMTETGFSVLGGGLQVAFPALAPVIGLIGGVIGGIRRRRNGH